MASQSGQGQEGLCRAAGGRHPSNRAPGSQGTQPSGPCSLGGPLPSPDFTPSNSLPPPAPPSPIGVFTIPPSFADIFLTKSAKLSCLVTNLASYDGLNISWSRQNGKALETHTYFERHLNDTFSARGEASVCSEDWESGEEFTCTVAHSDLPFPEKNSVSKPKGRPCPAPALHPRPSPGFCLLRTAGRASRGPTLADLTTVTPSPTQTSP